jgi:hypothetical protein
MVDQPQRHWGPSEDVSSIAGVQVWRSIPIAEHERLRDVGKELDRRIGRLGIEDRLALLAIIKERFPDPVIDKALAPSAVSSIVKRSGVASSDESNAYTPGGSDF